MQNGMSTKKPISYVCTVRTETPKYAHLFTTEKVTDYGNKYTNIYT